MDCTDILYVPKVIVPILTFNVPKLDVPKKRTESVCTEIVLYRKRPTPTYVVILRISLHVDEISSRSSAGACDERLRPIIGFLQPDVHAPLAGASAFSLGTPLGAFPANTNKLNFLRSSVMYAKT